MAEMNDIMSPYLPLNLKWRLTTKEGRCQWRSGLYRIYINIFAIFLRIPILPLSVSFKYKTLDFYYHGDTIIAYIKKGRVRYQSIGCEGTFDKLSDIKKFWNEYYEYEKNHPLDLEEINKEFDTLIEEKINEI